MAGAVLRDNAMNVYSQDYLPFWNQTETPHHKKATKNKSKEKKNRKQSPGRRDDPNGPLF